MEIELSENEGFNQHEFLQEVGRNPCLWHPRLKEFKNSNLKHRIWKSIGQKFNIPAKDALIHFKKCTEEFYRQKKIGGEKSELMKSMAFYNKNRVPGGGIMGRVRPPSPSDDDPPMKKQKIDNESEVSIIDDTDPIALDDDESTAIDHDESTAVDDDATTEDNALSSEANYDPVKQINNLVEKVNLPSSEKKYLVAEETKNVIPMPVPVLNIITPNFAPIRPAPTAPEQRQTLPSPRTHPVRTYPSASRPMLQQQATNSRNQISNGNPLGLPGVVTGTTDNLSLLQHNDKPGQVTIGKYLNQAIEKEAIEIRNRFKVELRNAVLQIKMKYDERRDRNRM